MKNSRMAQQLRLLSLKPSLEAEGDVKAGITGLYDPNHPADNGGPKDEDKHLTAKIVEVDDGPKTEAAKTEVENSVSLEAQIADAEAQLAHLKALQGSGKVRVTQESLIVAGAVAALLGIGTAFAFNKAAKLKNEYLALQKELTKKKGQLDALVTQLEAQARLELRKANISTEAYSDNVLTEKREKIGDLDRKISTGLIGGLTAASAFATILSKSSPVFVAINAGLATGVLLGNLIAVKKKRAELATISEELENKEIEIAQLAAEAKKAGTKVSQESIDDTESNMNAELMEAVKADPEVEIVEAEPIVEPAAAVVVEPEAVAQAPVVETPVVEVEPAIEPTAEEVEGEEAIDAYEEVIDEANEHAEEYEQAATSLESLIEALGEARQNGGLTPQSAKFFQIGFESIGVRLTGAPFKNAYGEDALPSLESFGGSMRRDAATQISMEAAESWYVKVWEVLKKTFAQIRDWVIKFVKAMFDQSARYNQRADKIIEVAGKVGAAKAKADKVTFGGARQIVTGSSVDAGSISKVLTVAQDAAVRTGESFKAIDAVKKYLVDMVSAGATDFGTFSEAEAAIQEGKLRSSLFSHEYNGEGENGFETDALPGNVKFRIAYQTHSSQSRFKVLVQGLLGARVTKESAGEIPEDLSARTLNPSEVADLARKVKAVLKAAEDSKKEFSVESLDIANVQVPQDDDAAKAKEKQKFINATVKAVSKASAGISQLLKYTIQTSGGYLDYANASLKQYGAQVDTQGKKEGDDVSQEALDVSMEGTSGALIGALIGLPFGLIGAVPGAIIGHTLQEKAKRKDAEALMLVQSIKAAQKANDDSKVEKLSEKLLQNQLEMAELRGQIKSAKE